MDHMTLRERRQAARIPVGIYVQQVVDDELHRCFTTSLSVDGLYMERLWAPMSRASNVVQLEVPLPETGDSLWAKGVIVYDCIDPLFHGMAVRFELMARKHSRLLREWIKETRRGLNDPLGRRATDLFRPPARALWS